MGGEVRTYGLTGLARSVTGLSTARLPFPLAEQLKLHPGSAETGELFHEVSQLGDLLRVQRWRYLARRDSCCSTMVAEYPIHGGTEVSRLNAPVFSSCELLPKNVRERFLLPLLLGAVGEMPYYRLQCISWRDLPNALRATFSGSCLNSLNRLAPSNRSASFMNI